MSFSRQELVELETALEGVRLPAEKEELVDYLAAQGPGARLKALLDGLPEGEYESLDEVAEALRRIQPAPEPARLQTPEPESGPPPGGESYLEQDPEPGAVRKSGPREPRE